MENRSIRAAESSQSLIRAKFARQKQKTHSGSIRRRLLLAFVFIAVLSATSISVGAILVGYVSGRQQAHERLDSVAALKALSIKAWADTLQTALLTVSSDQFASERVSVVLGLAKLGKAYVWYSESLRTRLHTFVEQSTQFEEICLVDVRGTVVLCSESPQTTDDCHSQWFFQTGLTSPSTEIVFVSSDQVPRSDGATAVSEPAVETTTCRVMTPTMHTPIAVIARPVLSSEGENLGVIVGRASSQGLTEILVDRTGLVDCLISILR